MATFNEALFGYAPVMYRHDPHEGHDICKEPRHTNSPLTNCFDFIKFTSVKAMSVITLVIKIFHW